jgi:hypothetical protein
LRVLLCHALLYLFRDCLDRALRVRLDHRDHDLLLALAEA